MGHRGGAHVLSDELHVWYMPVGGHSVLKVMPNALAALQGLVGGYVEQVATVQLPNLDCGCGLTMLVNEEGMLRNLPINPNATLAASRGIRGDALIVAEGPVKATKNEPAELSWFSLPPQFHHWKGPGHPFPEPRSLID